MTTTDASNNVGAPSVVPTFTFDDADAALRFLVDVLGFGESNVTRGDDGSIQHAELSWGGGLIMVGPKGAGSPFNVGPSCTYMALDDPDAHFERVTAGDVDVVMGLTDQPYGSREFAVRDAEGNLWCFGTYRPVPSPGT
jgi:uncharacterized glyoxalase superfamily protein PhnB